jgi:hypothetical protein
VPTPLIFEQRERDAADPIAKLEWEQTAKDWHQMANSIADTDDDIDPYEAITAGGKLGPWSRGFWLSGRIVGAGRRRRRAGWRGNARRFSSWQCRPD